jgi:hypothetical protein
MAGTEIDGNREDGAITNVFLQRVAMSLDRVRRLQGRLIQSSPSSDRHFNHKIVFAENRDPVPFDTRRF